MGSHELSSGPQVFDVRAIQHVFFPSLPVGPFVSLADSRSYHNSPADHQSGYFRHSIYRSSESLSGSPQLVEFTDNPHTAHRGRIVVN